VALQDDAGELRVTLDVELAFYLPPDDLWTRKSALVRGTFGSACASEGSCLVEVKTRAEMPAWLARALERADARTESFSKFLRAGEALHGSR
jgi:hypothetical protein